MPNDYFNPPNSIWPNGLKKDDEGYTVFHPLGTNKVDISTVTWPKGDTLISPFVYENNKLVGFVDTKALIVSGSATTTMNYNHIEADFASIKEGTLTIDAPNATVKEFKWETTVDSGNTGDTVVLGTKYLGCKTIAEVEAIDPNYKTTDIVDGAWSQSLADLEDGTMMFNNCSNLSSFSSDLSSMTDGNAMFNNCSNLSSFSSDLSSLTTSTRMFFNCFNLTSFKSNLSNLTKGPFMFEGCKLDTVSVQNIADTINTLDTPSDTGTIYISIGNSSPNEQEVAAFNAIASKNWIVYVGVNGEYGEEWNPASLIPIDGEKQQSSIPYWAKSVPSDEEDAQYVDEQGNFYNILGGNFIYGDDLETYGMFTCEEDAAANMRLIKIKKSYK